MLEMRELRGDDTFALLSIIGRLELRDELVALFEREVEVAPEPIQLSDYQGKKPTKKQLEEAEKQALELAAKRRKKGMEITADIIQLLLRNAKYARHEINEFLAELTGVTVAEIRDLGFIEYNKLFVDFFAKKELKDFLSSITSLMPKAANTNSKTPSSDDTPTL